MKTIGSIALIVTLLFIALACPVTPFHDGSGQCGLHVIAMHEEMLTTFAQTLLLLFVFAFALVLLFRTFSGEALLLVRAAIDHTDTASRPPSKERIRTVTISRAPPYRA